MEFLRLGSSIPGSYWGCCAVDYIQCFSVDPDEKASIQMVSGDGGESLGVFAGKTYREIFLTRIRTGTFDSRDMPNHAFLAVLTGEQLDTKEGLKWLKILKETGFEFIRAIDNSVYSGTSVISSPGAQASFSHPNYLFGLFRNIGSTGALEDPYHPPEAWLELTGPGSLTEAWRFIPDGKALNLQVQEAQLKVWNDLPELKFYTEEELEKEGIPIWYAGQRSMFPQELKAKREKTLKEHPDYVPSEGNPFDEDDYDDYEEDDEYYMEEDICDCEECICDAGELN